MDQVRTALAWLKRHHFWVLSALAALIAVGCWWSASGKLAKVFTTNQAAINSEFNNVANVRKEPFHANDDVNQKQAEQTTRQAKDVETLWQKLYDRQRAGVLKWPVPPLSKEFGDFVEKLQFGADIRSDLRNNYQNYVDGHFPELPKQIEARAIEASELGAGGPGGSYGRGQIGPEMGPGAGFTDGTGDENDYVCEWSPADQSIVRSQLDFPQQPSSLRIWVTQEDIWVYHTLLNIIAKTNQAASATRMSNAAVKSVFELSVGQRAAQYSRTTGRLLIPPPTPAVGAPGEGGPGGAPTGPEGAGPGGPGARAMEFSPERGGIGGMGGGQMTEEQERTLLLYGRYLDAQGKPIPFGSAGAVAGGEGAPPPTEAVLAGPAPPLDLTVFGQEYKRLPVRMVLRMDQRWLPKLISQCASEPLQVEVQEVRINPPDAGGSEGMGPGGGGFRGFGEGGPGGGGTANLFSEEMGIQPFPAQPEVVNVVIQGTIYIFNKPNSAVLQPTGDQPPPATTAAQ